MNTSFYFHAIIAVTININSSSKSIRSNSTKGSRSKSSSSTGNSITSSRITSRITIITIGLAHTDYKLNHFLTFSHYTGWPNWKAHWLAKSLKT